MPKITEILNVGDTSNLTPERLLQMMQDMYRDLAVAVNKKPDVYIRDTAGQASDVFLSDGDINIDRLTDTVEMLTNHTSISTVTWTTLS